jgi:hypothetical protein
LDYFGEMEMNEKKHEFDIPAADAALRDEIAMYALSSLIANRIQFPWVEAYKIADHMIEERLK